MIKVVVVAIALGAVLLSIATYVVRDPWSTPLTFVAVLGPICAIGVWHYLERRRSPHKSR
jgi:hypothetical protein